MTTDADGRPREGPAVETHVATAEQHTVRLDAEGSADRPLRRRRDAAGRMPPYRCTGGSELADRDPLVPDDHHHWRNRHDWHWARHPWLGTEWQRQRVAAAQVDGRWPA